MLSVCGPRSHLKPVAQRESALHVPKSTSAMWSATRIACAAMVSAGFTAAEDGKKEASTTNKFSWSKDLQNSFNAVLLDYFHIAEYRTDAKPRGFPSASQCSV